jgi:inner membrane protein involved in colicin E2 resistance
MKLFFLIFFILLGALDLLYGVLYKDQLSLLAGGAIVAITVYIWKKKN